MKNFVNGYAAVLVTILAAVVVSTVLLWVEGGYQTWEPNTGYQTPISQTAGK